jgi:fermentation-respiration switch protein FrsA (DUF1100 family)
MFQLLVAVMIVIVALAIGVRLLEPRLAFYPIAGETTTARDFDAPAAADSIQTADGERLRLWTLTHPYPRAVIVYFHGNGGNLSIWAPILAGIFHQGFSVVAFDYRGYGLSTGRPSERGLYRDADAILDYVSHRVDRRERVVYWGRSLGTAVAAYAATVRRPDGVILEAGFPDARSLIRSSPPMALLWLFSTYRFPTADLMRQAQAPVLVLHGDHDRIVPFELGRTLFERVGEPKQFAAVRGGDHNDVAPPDPQSYWRTISEFVERLSPEGEKK